MKRKFMQTLDDRINRKLEREAHKRGCTLQELLRAEIIPWWLLPLRKRKKARK